MSGSLVGGVDSSIPLQAGKNGQEAANPLSAIGPAAQLIGTLNQVRLMPGQLQLQQQAIQSGQANLLNQQKRLAYSSLAPLLDPSQGPINLDKVTSVLAKAENSGIVTGPTLDDLSSINLTGDPTKDDASFRSRITPNLQAPENAAAAVSMRPAGELDTGPYITPMQTPAPGMQGAGQVSTAGNSYKKGIAPQYLNQGNQYTPTSDGQQSGPSFTIHPSPINVDTGDRVGIPVENGVAKGPGVKTNLTPEAATSPVQIGVTPNGQPIMGNRSIFNQKLADQALGTGRNLPAALQNPNAPSQGLVTGLSPGQVAGQTAAASSGNDAFQKISQEGVAGRNQSAILGNMLGDLSGFTAGPERINEYTKTLQRYAPAIANAFGVTPEAVAKNESFDKLASQLASMQSAGGTDARLAISQNANPGSHLSPAGADLIIRQLQGNADYQSARAAMAAKYPDKTDNLGFESKVGAQLDPRAFQFDRMTPPQQADYVKGLSQTDQTKIHNSYKMARQQGILASQQQQ